MRRISFAAFLLTVTLLGATPANAVWRHHAWGRGPYGLGGWGYGGVGWRGCGWGGWGCRGYPALGCGTIGYPGFGLGCYPAYCAPWYGCCNNACGAGGGGVAVVLGNPFFVGGQFGRATRPRINFGSAERRLPLSEIVELRQSDRTLPRAGQRSGDPRLNSLDVGLDSVLTRFASIESRRTAERLLREGDELFREQNFHFALQKYKLAASTAPDLAEAFWRKGHALVATHNYELAATAFKRAIALAEDARRDGFELREIYGGAAMTKTQHLEALAEWALARADSADPYFLLGVFLHYDGQRARAAKFFAKAADVSGVSGGHLAMFRSPVTGSARLAPERAAVAKPVAPPVPISIGTEI